jgi:penicillin amidase
MADPDWPERLGHRGLSWRDVVLIGLGEGVSALRLTYGEDVAGWRWGRMHRLRLDHHLARGRALRQLLSRGPFEMAGDGDTPFQTGAAPWSLGSDVSVAPSVRLVIDLANPSRSISIHAPGQSGQPGSRHYDDLLPRWLRGAYHPMLWTRAEVEANLESEARLIPTDELWPRP